MDYEDAYEEYMKRYGDRWLEEAFTFEDGKEKLTGLGLLLLYSAAMVDKKAIQDGVREVPVDMGRYPEIYKILNNMNNTDTVENISIDIHSNMIIVTYTMNNELHTTAYSHPGYVPHGIIPNELILHYDLIGALNVYMTTDSHCYDRAEQLADIRKKYISASNKDNMMPKYMPKVIRTLLDNIKNEPDDKLAACTDNLLSYNDIVNLITAQYGIIDLSVPSVMEGSFKYQVAIPNEQTEELKTVYRTIKHAVRHHINDIYHKYASIDIRKLYMAPDAFVVFLNIGDGSCMIRLYAGGSDNILSSILYTSRGKRFSKTFDDWKSLMEAIADEVNNTIY